MCVIVELHHSSMTYTDGDIDKAGERTERERKERGGREEGEMRERDPTLTCLAAHQGSCVSSTQFRPPC